MLNQSSTVNLFGAFQLSDEDSHRRTDVTIGVMRDKLAGYHHPERCDGMCRRNPFVLVPICSALIENNGSTSRSESVSGSALEERRRDIISWIDDQAQQPLNYDDHEHVDNSPLAEGEKDGRSVDVESHYTNPHATGIMRRCRKEGDHDCFDDSNRCEPRYCHCSMTNPFRRYASKIPHAINEPDDRHDFNSNHNYNNSGLWPPQTNVDPGYHYHAVPTAECCCDAWQANAAKHGQQVVAPQPRTWASTREFPKALLDYDAPSSNTIKSDNPFNPFVKRMA